MEDYPGEVEQELKIMEIEAACQPHQAPSV